MYIVEEVNRATDQYLINSRREFDDFETALEYLAKSYKEIYGDDAEIHAEFWDPFNKEDSTALFSIEMFATDSDTGFYMFRDWSKVH